MLDAVTETVEAELGVRDKVLDDLVIVTEAAVPLLKLKWVIPVEDRDPWDDVCSQKGVDLEGISGITILATLRDVPGPSST